MAKAIREFLAASGVPVNGDLKATPGRVALAWEEDFLDGYRADPKKILSEVIPARSRELVVAKGIDFTPCAPTTSSPIAGWPMWPTCPRGRSWASGPW